MSLPLLLLLIGLSAFRITRLLAEDTLPLVARPRAWAEAKLGPGWGDLISCSFCLGVYVSAGMVALVDHYHPLPYPLLVWGACAAVVGLLSGAD